jgi:hypothetical protein
VRAARAFGKIVFFTHRVWFMFLTHTASVPLVTPSEH